jgi:8-oxo-dGTP pyrophosphatase MutT (NUDIX family)
MPIQPLLDRSIDPLELVELTQQWGVPPLRQVTLTVDEPFLTGENQLLTKNGRRAEICYVMHRGNPADGLLLHIKTFYPSGAYRLPTGGIQVGEGVLHALEREILEETGLHLGSAPGEVQLNGLLGVLAYDLLHRQLGPVEFATYFFLVQMPPTAELHPLDDDEHIGGWEWCTPPELQRVAEVLDTVHTRSSTWADWGHFRAAGHRFVANLPLKPVRSSLPIAGKK